MIGGACVIVGLDVIHHLVYGGEGQTDIAVGAAIVQSDAAGVGILQGGAGEADVGHEAALLIPLFRGQKEVAAAVQYLTGLVLIQNGTADGVDEAIAGSGNAVVEQQPALAGLNGGSTAADLHALPPVGALAHHMAVTTPELHIRALAQEDVTKGGVAAVRRAAQQGVHAVDLAGEQHGVAVEGDKGVLDADKGLEVGSLGDADKQMFRRQILGRRDSFGKIYAVTQQLDMLQPQEIYRKTVQIMEDVLENHSLTMQIEMGCNAEKCIVIPNGVQYERFCNIPLKQEDGWVDIGAVVRLAPIKDVKTMIYAFFELASRMPNVRLHIMGGVDDEDYAKECYALVEQLQLKNLIFTGRVDVVQYMQKLDFTILTSISEGQPLSVLESMAARRPCVTTEVGCCRELLEGTPGDTFGIAGYCVPPMYRQGLADAMEKMCASRARREEMGRIGQRRVDAYFHHEQMLANYRKMYDETAKEYHLE